MLVESKIIFIPGDSPDPQSLVYDLLGKSSKKKNHSQVMLDTVVIVCVSVA